MADGDLASTIKNFMEQMTIRQTALEEKMATRQTSLEEQISNLAIIVQEANQSPRKTNSGDARNRNNNVVSRANMAGADLASMMKDFFERIDKITTRQTALKEKMATRQTALEEAMATRQTALEVPMATRQTALEKQIANHSIIVLGASKGPRKDNQEVARNSSSNNNAQGDKNSSQMEEEPRRERFRPLANCKQPKIRTGRTLSINIELQQSKNLRVALNIARAFERKLKGSQGLLSTHGSKTYPEFELEDKLKVERGSDDMDPTVGKRKIYDSAD
jgi:hypothetical protein